MSVRQSPAARNFCCIFFGNFYNRQNALAARNALPRRDPHRITGTAASVSRVGNQASVPGIPNAQPRHTRRQQIERLAAELAGRHRWPLVREVRSFERETDAAERGTHLGGGG